jgi:hypothetical protein
VHCQLLYFYSSFKCSPVKIFGLCRIWHRFMDHILWICVSIYYILVKLLVGDLVFNVISAYAPQIGLNESVKMQF